MRIKELLSGNTLSEEVGPGQDWDPHQMGPQGAMPGFTSPRAPAPIAPMGAPMAPAVPGRVADAGPSVGPNGDWNPHQMGPQGAVPGFAGPRAPAPAPMAPMGAPMPGDRSAMAIDPKLTA